MDRIGIAFEGAQRQQTLHLWDLESVGAREGAATVRGERHALTALVWPGGLFWFPRSAGPIPAAFGPVAFSLGRCLFRFLCSLTSRSALRLYSASCSNSKNSTRSSGGSILAVAKSSLSCFDVRFELFRHGFAVSLRQFVKHHSSMSLLL